MAGGPEKRDRSAARDSVASPMKAKPAEGRDVPAASAAPAGGPKDAKKAGSKKMALVGGAAEMVPLLILGYACYVGKFFYAQLYPTFGDFDENHNYIEKFTNRIPIGDELTVHLYLSSGTRASVARDAVPHWTYRFKYDQDSFEPGETVVMANVSEKLLTKNKNLWLTARTSTKEGQVFGEAHGKIVKYSKQKQKIMYWLLSGNVCVDGEKAYGTKKEPMVARGIPKIQVRLVYDRTAYPPPWKRQHYYPMVYVDEFWLTDDQLIKFNNTGQNQFPVDVHFGLMSAPRWRFQYMMERQIEAMASSFGEDSEDVVAMRDLFANTNSYLLLATMIVSVLHMIFEYLALKSDVQFWNKTDAETLKKFVSLRCVVLEILSNIVLLIYLYDQDSNVLLLVLSACQILVDCWKLTRVIKVSFHIKAYIIPCPSFESKVPTTGAEDYDKIALKYLSFILVPCVFGYAGYSAYYECHKGVVSYVLHVSASCVYALGFALMTPQLFINYRMKSVANLPWRRFIYRAINTFIDDLFAFIIKMPTMHRMSCFRDDIVFIIYLYQRHIYPIDKSRNFDEDLADEVAAGEAEKKDK